VSATGVIDCDQHLFESRTLWADYAAPSGRGQALCIVDDEVGNSWLTWQGRRIVLADVTVPGETEEVGARLQRALAGNPPEHRYDDALPLEYWQPAARLGELDRLGLDEAFLFPNYGLAWEHTLAGDLDATKTNMAAWNRWVLEVAAEGQGRLHAADAVADDHMVHSSETSSRPDETTDPCDSIPRHPRKGDPPCSASSSPPTTTWPA